MIEKILAALKESGTELYQITETKEESAELFFIRKSLDMQRLKEVHRASVTVYRAFTEGDRRMLGSAAVQVQESFTTEQMTELFRNALYAAGFVKNPYYELYAGKGEPSAEALERSGHLSGQPLTEVAHRFADALFEEDRESDVFLNSAEIFAGRTTCHIFSYDDMDTAALQKKVRDTLEMTRARARAVSAPPAGEYRVILSGAYVKTIFDYYVERSNGYMIYPKYSTFQNGCDVQGGQVEKDRINLTLKATVPYSVEGIPMKDRELVRDGMLQLIHGSNRYAYYLNLEPTGNYDSFSAPAGSVPLEKMREEPYLEIVNFSDFQMDTFDGHFGGEIRLGFLYDGEKRIPVTGGSINGSILDAQKNLVFSRETQVEKNFQGPAAVCLEGVNVAGSTEA